MVYKPTYNWGGHNLVYEGFRKWWIPKSLFCFCPKNVPPILSNELDNLGYLILGKLHMCHVQVAWCMVCGHAAVLRNQPSSTLLNFAACPVKYVK